MNNSEKKFYPKLYPVDRDMTREWFIKYYIKDYNKGKLVSRRYKGALNLEIDIKKRLQLAKKYIDIIEKDDILPYCKGARSIQTTHEPKTFADITRLCYDTLLHKSIEIESDTYKGYRSRVQKLSKWLVENKIQNLPIGSFKKSHAELFLLSLKKEKYNNSTINYYKVQFGFIWKILIENGIINDNPWQKIKKIRSSPKSFTALTNEYENIILNELPEYDLQLFICVLFIYCNFIRVIECSRLKLNLINWEKGSLKITSNINIKSKKEREVIIPNQLFNILLENKYHLYDQSFYIFSKNNAPGSEPLAKNNLRNRFAKFRKDFNIPNEYKLYGCKHTGNSKLAMMGINAQIQQFHNGHASLEYTQRYNSGLDTSKMDILKNNFPELGTASVNLLTNKFDLEKKIDELLNLLKK